MDKQQSVEPYARCVTCNKPSWHVSDIKYSNWKWKAYYCLACSPMTQKESQGSGPKKLETHPLDSLDLPPETTPVSEPVYQRPESEVQAEIDFLQTHSIVDIPF